MRRISHLAALRAGSDPQKAKQLRSDMTDAELALWYRLRAHRLQGHKFRRQVPLGPYVADFLCEKARLIVEVDGGQHADRIEADATRTRWLSAQGYEVMRFWNNEVLANMDGVLEVLMAALSRKA